MDPRAAVLVFYQELLYFASHLLTYETSQEEKKTDKKRDTERLTDMDARIPGHMNRQTDGCMTLPKLGRDILSKIYDLPIFS